MLGVSSVWMKIVRLDCAEGRVCRIHACLRGSVVGRCRWVDTVMGLAPVASENDRLIVLVAGLARRTPLDAGRGSILATFVIADLLDMIAN